MAAVTDARALGRPVEVREPENGGALYRRLREEVAAAGLSSGMRGPIVTDDDLAPLPEPAQRYLRYMGVLGRPRDWSFRVRSRGRFRRRPGEMWMPVDAWQYSSSVGIARLFVIRGRLSRLVPIVGRDTYLRGRARLRVRLVDRVTVADGRGAEYDHSELLIWLNDAVFLAPSMLLRPAVSWDLVDADSFGLTVSDGDGGASARVFVAADGAPIDFHASRYATLPSGAVLLPWRTPVSDWQLVDGRPFPGPGAAFFDLPDGPFCYIELRFEPETITYNIDPLAL